MPNSPLAHALGDAIAAPIRLATVLQRSIAALDEVTGDAVRDAATLTLAATERSAAVAAGASAAPSRAETPDDASTTVAVTLPGPDAEPAGPDAPAVHVRTGPHGPADESDGASSASSAGAADRIVSYSAPELVPHKHRRVDYDFFSGIAPEIRNPGGTLRGANLWDSPPSAERPVPVVLVHGTAGGGQTNWGPYVPLLTNHGFSVFTLTYGAIPGSAWPVSAMGGMRRIEDSAAEFGAFVERVLDATGAPRVDVVGHSQGTLVPGYWAKHLGGADRIRRYVSLAPLWQGTRAFAALRGTLATVGMRFGVAGLDVAASLSIPQMITGSDFLTELWSGGTPYVAGIEYTNISTRHDEFVVPYTSGQVPGGPDMDVTNIVVQEGCPADHSDHLGICGSRRAATIVLNALDDIDQTPVPVGFVPPFFG
ncbi:esterase/lipase family protein [Tomitella cavernea]|uniref:Triacylglycerol lipase n=1 Tax=Tomitella cavernea TaxID=1387982 RepID=A0ABP9D1M9_9ACTN|nr:alpha/beta fold hydrolase [Tomitella cavernea]